jgi:hypothetical protein
MAATRSIRSTQAPSPTRLRASDVGLRAAIVGLTLATGYIHLTLGGLLFTLNGIGYVVAATAMAIPLGLAIRFRWFIRLGLFGYAAASIVGWYLTGPRYELAYIAKVIEIALVALLAVDFGRHDGSPIAVLRRVVGR